MTLLDELFGRNAPQAVIIGENHEQCNHAQYEAELIRQKRPEYVLMECLKTSNPGDTDKAFRYVSLKDLSEVMKKNLEDFGISQETVDKIREGAPSYGYVWETRVPRTLGELTEMPFYDFNPGALSAVADAVGEKARSSQDDGARLNMLEGFLRDWIPMIHDYKNRWHWKIYHEVIKSGGKLAGCDNRELPKEVELMSENMNRLQESLRTCNEQERNVLETELSMVRYELARTMHDSVSEASNGQMEEYAGRRIAEFARARREESTPVVAIMGAAHTEDGSRIHETLKREGIRYKVVRLEDPNGRNAASAGSETPVNP